MVKVTRFPFLFWGMRSEPHAYLEDGHLKKDNKQYEIKRKSILLYIFPKYIIVFIGLSFLFTRYDFLASFDKFLQYSFALVLAFLVLILPKKYMFFMAIVICIFAIIAVFVSKLYFVSFVLKYFITFFILFGLLLDIKKEHYYIFENNKIVANAIVGGEIE